jgi:hypothetical protein
LSMNSQRLFKKEMSEEQIRENYKSPMTKQGDYGAFFLNCDSSLQSNYVEQNAPLVSQRAKDPKWGISMRF